MKTRLLATRLLWLLAASVILAAVVYGQAISSDLVGTVTDSSGAALPNATITAANKNTGVKTTTTTNSAGQYRLNNLLVGQYDVTAKASGFTTATISDVSLDLNHTATVNLTLQVGSVSTTVEVTAAAAPIDTTSSQLQTTFTTSLAEDIGVAANSKVINGSGIWNLSLLSAGVGSGGGIGQGTGPSIAGQRPENNSFNVDGVSDDDHYGTGPQIAVPNDAVAEMSVLQNQFSPEFGGASGGVFNAILKSGTNQIHGSVYEYFQNRDLNALDQQQRQAGLTSQPRYDFNRLGGTVGGPIIKDKLFYFGLFEYDPLGQASVPSGTVYAPTSAGLNAIAALPGVNTNNLTAFKQYVPVAATQTQVLTEGGGNPANPRPDLPLLSIPVGPLTFASPNYFNTYNGLVSVDYNMSDKDQLRGRFMYNNATGLDAVANLPVFFQPEPIINKSGSFSEFHTFTATMQNEFRASYSRSNQYVGAGNYKFPGLAMFPNLAFDDLSLQVGPDPNTPSGYIENRSTLQENLTKTWGRHTFKAGYQATDVILAGSFVQRARGDYNYVSLEEYLLDLAPTGGNLSGVSGERSAGAATVPFGFLQQAGYFNDDFRIRANLTLNLGVRYEYVQVPVGSRYQSASAIADVPGVINFAAPKSGTNDWSPRIGFAYSPGTSGAWSFRGGFARSFDNTYINLNQNASPAYWQTTLDCSGVPGDTTNPVCPASGFLANGGLVSTVGGGGWASPADARAAVASYTFDQTNRPYALTGTLGVQHLIGKDYTIEARYVYTKGVHLWNQTRMNIVSKVTPTDYLPTFLTMPDQATINGLTNTLAQISSKPKNDLAQYGFPNNITGYHPWGNSRYNGLALQMTKRYSKNFQYLAAFTWSHAQDDSTATNFSTILSPRRAQDFQNMAGEWADSALNHKFRFTFTPMYDFRPFQNSRWMMKNLVGNWNVSFTYTYQSPEYAVVQSGVDSNLNGDSAGDRSIINPAGASNVGSGVTPIINTNGDTVGYVANNPNARYIVAGPGALANAGRNTFPFDPINNVDFSLKKMFNITEHKSFQVGIQAFNLFNHAQFTGGYLSDVSPFFTNAVPRNSLVPSNADFGHYNLYFPSNARSVTLVGKFVF